MWKRIVGHTFVHAAVQLTTSLAERVWSINGDVAPFRSHKTLFSNVLLCLYPHTLVWLLQTIFKQVCIYRLGLCNKPCTKSCKTPRGFFSNFYQISGFKFGPSCKACPCLNMLLAAAFPATWCFRSLRMQNKHCRKKNKKKMFFGSIGFQVQVQAQRQEYAQKNLKKCLVLCNSFCRACFAFEGCKNNMLLEMLPPARKSSKNISCTRGKISTLGSRFLC